MLRSMFAKNLFKLRVALLESALQLSQSSVSVSDTPTKNPRLFIEVGRIVNGYTVGGIPRVATELARAILRLERGIQVNFVEITTRGQISYADHKAASNLGLAPSFPKKGTVTFSPGDSLLILDLALPPNFLRSREIYRLRHSRVLVASVVYDLLPITNPEWFKPGKGVLFFIWLRAIAKQDLLLAISESTELELRSQLSILTDGDLPQISRLKLSSKFAPKSSRQTCRRKRRPPDSTCFLMVGTIEPRKGYDEVLETFQSIWESGGSPKLKIVGRKGWKCARTIRKIRFLIDSGYPLRWESDCSDEDLFVEYQNADAVIVASYSEGFGLPVLEAQSMQLPVIVRDIPVFREISSPRAIYFGGHSSPSLREVIVETAAHLSDGEVPIAGGSKHASWEGSAFELLSTMNAQLLTPARESAPKVEKNQP